MGLKMTNLKVKHLPGANELTHDFWASYIAPVPADINMYLQSIKNQHHRLTLLIFSSKLYFLWICSFIHVSKQWLCVLFQRNLMLLLRNSWCNPIQVHDKYKKLIKGAKNNLCVSLGTL